MSESLKRVKFKKKLKEKSKIKQKNWKFGRRSKNKLIKNPKNWNKKKLWKKIKN